MVKSAVEAFIDTHGAAKLAGLVGRGVSAVRLWKHRHIIPRTAWPELIAKLDVSMDDLLEIEALSKPFADRARAERRAA